ncbi:pre-neck appendage protein [Synechococcus phage S-SM2]|uniref:Peptidase G2 IMC autoproteolytic cleavage domain-containing protein n=1 Tax=Synechococcus phage S-SM2 TaxID=444860 RepID=E3SIT4_9CAUD|nr:pre-neck appendage protein [Synechococcus phage S-SM2]ADO97382.1 hypothetical protein SSM2_040 [Synechococcus phage S-SM2]
MAFRTNATEKVRIKSDGDVGIGTADPQVKLHIRDADPYIRLEDSAAPTGYSQIMGTHQGAIAFSADTSDSVADSHLRFDVDGSEKLRITSAGRIGIGTAEPDRLLVVAGSDPIIRSEDTDTGNTYAEFKQLAGSLFIDSRNDSSDGTIIFRGVGGGSATEKLRITSGGNVDINGTPPWTVTGAGYRNLSISGNDASSSGFLWLGNGAAATNADFDLGRVNFVNGANIVAQIKGSTQTSANDDGRIAFFTKATGSNISEKLRITSDGRFKIGTISDYSSDVTNAPVYIAMQSDITGVGDDEGGATAGMVRIEETGSNDGRFHGIELRNKNAGDIRLFNLDRSTADRGDLILVMPDEDANDGTHLKMRVNSLKSSIQISGKGGAVAGNQQQNHTDIYIATKTGVTAVDTGVGNEIAGIIRFEDIGSNDNRFHGIEIRNKNSGDVRILNKDEGTTNKASLVFAIDNGGIEEAMRIDSAGRLLSGLTSFSAGTAAAFGGNSSVADGNGVIFITRGHSNAMSAGDGIGNIEFGNSTGNVFARISAEAGAATGAGGSNDYPGQLKFWTTADGGSSPTQAAIINKDGSVGINETSPSATVDINNGSRTHTFLELQGSDNTALGFFLTHTSTSYTGDGMKVHHNRAGTSAMNFLVCDSDHSGTPDRQFTLRGDGNAFADGTWSPNGADYAEYFESSTGAAIPVGTTVVLENNKVRAATSEDSASSIMGVVRPKAPGKIASVIGNSAWNKWSNKYLTDDFDRFILDEHLVYEWTETGEDGQEINHSYESHQIPEGVTIPSDVVGQTHDSKGNRFVHYRLNPDFDPSVTYVPREERDEWIIVGLIGQVKILDGQPMNDRWVKMRDVSDSVEEWFIR